VDAQKKYDDPRTSVDDVEDLKPKIDVVKKCSHKNYLRQNLVKQIKTINYVKI
jgi:hypothetical protein